MTPSGTLLSGAMTPMYPEASAQDSDRYKVVNFVDATRYTGVAAWRVFETSRSGRIAAGNPSRRE